MQNFFSTGAVMVKNMAKKHGANRAENLERGPFGVFRCTILNGVADTQSLPLKTPLRCILLIYNIDKVDIAKFKTSICNISQFLSQRNF